MFYCTSTCPVFDDTSWDVEIHLFECNILLNKSLCAQGKGHDINLLMNPKYLNVVVLNICKNV